MTIDQKTIDLANALNLAGDYTGAYLVLSAAGDTYSAAAADIIGNNDGYFQGTVQRLWDNVRPGSVSLYWDEVAGQHQANYIGLLKVSGGVLPSTYEIEQSYVDALDVSGLPPTLAIDVVINTVNSGSIGLLTPEWYTLLGLDPSRISSDQVTLNISSVKALTYLLDAGMPATFEQLGIEPNDRARYYPTENGFIEVFFVKGIDGVVTYDYPVLQKHYQFDENGVPQLIAHTDPHGVVTRVDQHCFLSDTPIQMWPVDPSIQPRADGSYDEAFVLSKVWEKPISEIKVGDIVVAYDDKGRLGPKHVLRTMENRATHILDFWGTGTTPSHPYFCADGPNKDGHAPIMDILRMDGAIMRADGTMIRAATKCKVGSMGDMMIHASATRQRPDGSWTAPKAGKVRFGTRIILPDGRHLSLMEMAASEGWKVTDDGYMVGIMNGEDGELQEQTFLFPYTNGEELPKPEDYILARSSVTLEEIYAAGEWEQIGTRMTAPAGMVGLNTKPTSTLLQPSKPRHNIPPAFANRSDAPIERDRTAKA